MTRTVTPLWRSSSWRRRFSTRSNYDALYRRLVQPTLQFFLSYGFSIADVRALFKKEPTLLHLPLETRLKPVVAFLDRTEVNEDVYGPTLNRSELRQAIQSHPELLKLSVESQLRTVFHFWRRDLKLSPPQVTSLATRAPVLMSYSLTQLRPHMLFFHNRFAKSDEIVEIFAAFPAVLERPVAQLMQFYAYWKSIEMSDRDFMAMIARHPPLLKLDLASVLKPVLEYLVFIARHRRGARLVVNHPDLFETPLPELSHRIESLIKMGISRYDVVMTLRSHPQILKHDIQPRIRALAESGHLTAARLAQLLPEFPELVIEGGGVVRETHRDVRVTHWSCPIY